MPRVFARRDPFVFKTLPLLMETFPDGLVYQALGLPLNFQQMLVHRRRTEVADPQCFVVELANLGVSVRLTLNWQSRGYRMLARQRQLDHSGTVFKLISGYIPTHELNPPLLAAIQEATEECLVEAAGGWFGGRFGDTWLPTPHQGSLRYRENSHFIFTPLSGAARSVQVGSLRLLERPRAYVYLLTASLQLVYDMCLESPRDTHEPSLYHVNERFESDPLVTRLDHRRPDLYLLPLGQGRPTGDLLTLCEDQLHPAVTRDLQLVESFTVQDGWLVCGERIRFRDWLALWPSSNGDQADGGCDHVNAQTGRALSPFLLQLVGGFTERVASSDEQLDLLSILEDVEDLRIPRLLLQ